MSDRMANELLLGVLAVQNQLISESALRAAVAEWQAERNEDGRAKQPLVKILVERHGLAPEIRAALEPLVAAHIKQHEGDPDKSLAALSSVSTLVRDLRRKIDPGATHAWKASPTSEKSEASGESREDASRSRRSRGVESGAYALDLNSLCQIDDRVDQFEALWDEHQCPRLETFLADWSGPHQDALFRELLWAELHRLQVQQNREISEAEYQQRFPQFEPVVRQVFRGRGRHFGSPRRFRILKEHAAGGLGVVYRAYDQELDREVALKQILPKMVDHEDAQRRFLLEAEITGGLEHPGIVPVYSLGRYDDGRPFYAMRFIKGHNLQEAIKQFHSQARTASEGSSEPTASQPPTATHKRSPVTPFSTSNLQFRELLGRFVDVCQAIAYAHSRGVLHRDLKPGNVMLGKYGETLVVDWGLAKALQKSSETSTNESDSSLESALHPATAQDHEQTVAGPQSVLGSPQYMSPEQASGKIDELGPATDVFSLGAVLFELLTGQPPIGSDIPEDEDARLRQAGKLGDARLMRAKQGDFPSPRQLRPDVPAPLEAVCLKAMSFRADARYESAQLLAEDIERWLADEPVSVWREPFSIRAQRWMKQHRTVVATTAAMFLMGFIGLVGWGVLSSQHNTQLRQQTKLTERHLYVARMNLAQIAWEGNRVGETIRLLELHRPAAGDEGGPDDLRGFEWFYWDRCCHTDLLTLNGHTDSVMSVVFSPDGKRLASASSDQMIKVWDAATGQKSLALKGHTAGVVSVAFSSDGRRLASASDDQTVKVWDAATGQESLTLEGHTATVLSVAFSSDGKWLASASRDHTVKVWDAVTGQESLTLKGHTAEVSSVAFSPDGRWLASASHDLSVRLWDVATGQELLTLKGHTNYLMGVVFSPNGQRLGSASWDRTIKVWNVSADAQGAPTVQESLTLKGHTDGVLSVAFSPDGQRLASASWDQTVKVWDATTGEESLTLNGHTGYVNSVAFSLDGQRLASASSDRMVQVWNLPADKKVAATSQNSVTLKGHTAAVTSVAYSRDGQRLASASADQTVKVWNLSTDSQGISTGQELLTLKGHTDRVVSVAFSPDGQRLASASWDSTIKLWDMVTGQESLTLKGHSDQVHCVVFSPDGQRLASTSEDQTVRVWDLSADMHDESAGQKSLKLKEDADRVVSVVFSPDGRRLAAASFDRTLRVWDTATGQDLLTLKGHKDGVRSVVFSTDGQRIASASFDGTAKVWDAATGQELLTLKGHSNSVECVAFSPDGKRLASASRDQTVKVWDAATGQESLTLKGHTNWVTSVAFSPNGQRLASASGDGTVKVWDATPRP